MPNLILTRKRRESIRIGDNIKITIVKIQGERVHLAVEAPSCVKVLRCELDLDHAVVVHFDGHSPVPESATIGGMTRDHQHNPDPNANAARIVREATADQNSAPADLEVAWAEWSSHIQKVDGRGMALIKAAFEAGWDAGRQSRQN